MTTSATLGISTHQVVPMFCSTSETLSTGSPLLSLPAEIRRIIWNYVFILPQAETPLALSPHAAKHKSVLRVLCVCRTIYAEAVPLFYRFNVLVISSTSALFTFLSSLHPLRRSEITALTVRGFGLHWSSSHCATQSFSLLLLCSKLKRFRLDLTTEESWDLLEFAPWHAVRSSWDELDEGIDCLSNLRGLDFGSIRGINPSVWRRNQGYGLSDLEEVIGSRADTLRSAWLKPTRRCLTRFDKAIVHEKRRCRTSLAHETSARCAEASGDKTFRISEDEICRIPRPLPVWLLRMPNGLSNGLRMNITQNLGTKNSDTSCKRMKVGDISD